MKSMRWIAGALLVLGMVGAAAAADTSKVDELAREGWWMKGKNAEKDKQVYERLGKPAPILDLSGWINGDVTGDKIKGQIVVVDFWATWCGPCIAAIPHNNEVSRKYADKGVLLIGACGGGGEEKMGNIVQAKKIEYPTAKVSRESVKAWEISFWPTYAIIDRKGNLRAFGLRPDMVEKVLDALIEEQPVEKKK